MRGKRVVVLLVCVACARGLRADDWPAYRHDVARSGVTAEQLPTPLHRQWLHVSPHKPMPAWPEPGRELNRLAFDYAPDVAIAGGLAYYGSSADGKVYALDLATGRVRWAFFSEGPIRFAPTVAEGRVFVGSDDGWLYCLAAATGELVWKFRGGPRAEMLVGNGRLVSRWPLRSGVGVADGVVYVTAGMWPSEGVYVHALDAATGAVLWQNATSGTGYVTQPHPGSFSMTGVSPQGYLLAREGQLFVPTGRSVPAAFDRDTGKLLYYRSQPTSWGNRWGGCWNVLAGDLLFGWRCHVGPDIDVRVGEYKPDKNDGMVCFDARTGKERREFPGKLDAVVSGGVLYATGAGKLAAYDLAAWLKGAKAQACTKWEADHPRAYALILAGKTLFVGGNGSVTAVHAGRGKVLWSDKVQGQARSLAVAGGRLLASTTAGEIACYGPETVAEPPRVSPDKPASPFADEDAGAAALARRILDETGKREGFCLALGAGDGRLLYELARGSKLTVCCVEPSAKRAAAARRALDAEGLYGVRVSVHAGSLRDLACPDYLADLVVPGGGSSRTLRRCSASELYRVLRPCGGVVWVPAAERGRVSVRAVGRLVERVATLGSRGPLSAGAIVQWLERGGVPEAEIEASQSTVRVVRGKLPGSDDWTHQYATAGRTGASREMRARLPLKLLWFGEPGPARLLTRHWGGPAPLCVDGRMFVPGQYSLMAHDAYNGRELWRRDFAKVCWWHVRAKGASVAADADGVYLVQDRACLRLDPATGKTAQTYQLPQPPAAIAAADAPKLRWSYLAVGHGRILGMMGGEKSGRAVFALGKDGKPLWTWAGHGAVNINSLSMDAERVYAIDCASADAIAKAKRRAETIPPARLVALDAKTGKPAWQTAEGIQGRTDLWLSDGVLVAGSPGGLSGYEAAKGKLLYVRDAGHRRFPVIAAGTIYVEPYAYDLRTGEPRQRPSPFTGQTTPWRFQRSYGCGAIAGSPHLLMFRSGTLGFCDLAGDGGIFNFGGVRAGCYVNAIAAAGLVLCPPADAACTCSYSLRTTVALAPAPRHEQWGVFYDRLPATAVRHGAFNLGAPGDRRDADGRLWLALPRPVTRSHRKDMAVPFRLTVADGFGPYRQGAAPGAVGGTERPWLYANGVRGLRRLELDLQVLDRGFAAWPARQRPKIDGHLIEPVWEDARAYAVGGGNGSVTVMADGDALYLGYRRAGAGPWKAGTKGEDAEVWRDHSFEAYVSAAPASAQASSKRCLHLGLAASGARYDAAWRYVSPFPALDIPKLEVTVDGKPGDWGAGGLRVLSLPGAKGKMRPPANFDPSFRIAWNERGLLVLATVKDNVALEAANAGRLWEGDSIELFMAPGLGTNDGFQLVVSPGADPKHPKPRWRFYDRRKATRGAALAAQIAGSKTADGYVVEMLLPWQNLKLEPTPNRTVAVQLFANDKDKPGKGDPFRVLWHPGGHPVNDRKPDAYQLFCLARAPAPPVAFTRSAKPGKDGLHTAVAPHPFPLTVPPLGAQGERARYQGDWGGAARADGGAFVAEMAIPWRTLEALGIQRGAMLLDVTSRGPLRRAPKLGQGHERLLVVPKEQARPRTVSVRLHFAEPDAVRRGERVFDVKLQGKVVLSDFDVVRAARGVRRAVVRQFDGIEASRVLRVELVAKAAELGPATAPILSAIEIVPPPEPE